MNNKDKALQMKKSHCNADERNKDLSNTWYSGARLHGDAYDGNEKKNSSESGHNAKGIYYMERHEMKNGKLTKIKGFNVSNVFLPIYMTRDEAKGWVTQSGEVFPPRDMWVALRKHYGKYYIRETLELNGMGLFTTCDIKAGDFIGIYAGTKTATKGEYVMELGETLLDGSPRGDDKLFYMGRINDWYWGGPEQNCKVHEGGVITATRHIKKDEQLCMSYGPGYCWDGVKRRLLLQLPRLLRRVLEELGIEQYNDELELFTQRLERLGQDWRAELRKDNLSIHRWHAGGIHPSICAGCTGNGDIL